MSNPTATALSSASAKSIADLRQMGLVYLATPYSKFPDGMEAAFIEAAMLAGRLLLAGVKVYSPIAHTHPIAVYANINPLDHKIWLPFDEAMMEAADALVVAEMRSWSTSFGIAHEIEYFTRADKPVFYLDPERLVLRATPGAVSLKEEAA
jgi:nucleoside 2-deoxyribosyltransferase